MKKYFNKLNESSHDNDRNIYQYGEHIIDNYLVKKQLCLHDMKKNKFFNETYSFLSKNAVNIDKVLNEFKDSGYDKYNIVFFRVKDTSRYNNIFLCSMDYKLYKLSKGNNIYISRYYGMNDFEDIPEFGYKTMEVIMIDDIIEGAIGSTILPIKLHKFDFINKELTDFFKEIVDKVGDEKYKGINITDYYNAGYESIVVYFIMEDIYNIYNGVPNCYLQCAMTSYKDNNIITPYINIKPLYIYSNNPIPDYLMNELKEARSNEQFSFLYVDIIDNYKLL